MTKGKKALLLPNEADGVVVDREILLPWSAEDANNPRITMLEILHREFIEKMFGELLDSYEVLLHGSDADVFRTVGNCDIVVMSVNHTVVKSIPLMNFSNF